MVGCAVQQPEMLTIANEEQQYEIIRLQKLLETKEQEISRLKNHQKNQGLEINSLRANQKHQVQELKDSTNQVARAEVKLRRFATETDVASRLAEVEVAMEVLQSSLDADNKLPLQPLAQNFLDKASACFKRSEYSAAADHAAQAEQLINMLMDDQAVAGLQVVSETSFKVAIPLMIKVDSQLRREPHSKAAVLNKLQKATQITARSYQGQWLGVQTEDGNTGWVSADIVEPR